MLKVYCQTGQLLDIELNMSLPEEVIWVDALQPSPEECQWLMQNFHRDIPTLDKMQEIEATSRMYQEGETLYLTANLIACAQLPQPESVPVTFILDEHHLITIRFADPKPFGTAMRLLPKQRPTTATAVFCLLLEAVVDRIADILEEIGYAVDEVSRDVFQKWGGGRNLLSVLTMIGRKGDLSTNVRLSLENLNRLVKFSMTRELSFLSQEKTMVRLLGLQQDISSIIDYVTFLSNKINFLLDATLGVINLEQSRIIKIFSMAAVIFLPPMLIASIYGMNFPHIPELKWHFGYPIALAVMCLSSIVSYGYFKRRGWL